MLFLSDEFLNSESSLLNAVYRLSLLVEGPPSPLCCCSCCVFVSSRGLLPHIKLHSPSGGGRVKLLVWVALFGSRCCCASLVFVFVFLVLLLFSFPLLCSLSELWICGVASSDLA